MRLSIVAMLVWLAGCTSLGQYDATVAKKSAESADRMHQRAIWLECNGTSLGAFRRAFPNDTDRARELQRCDKLDAIK